jgi:hypothetical protein
VSGIRKLALMAMVGTTCAALMSVSAQARMYQWKSAATGAAQLSGEPPAWYRSDRGGPRVRVFDSGNLVDDTAIKLPRNQSDELRAEAFRESEQRQRTDALKRLERLARQQQRRRVEQERLAKERFETEEQLAQQLKSEEADSEAAPPVSSISPNETLDDATVARLKAIIGEFDRRGGQSR